MLSSYFGKNFGVDKYVVIYYTVWEKNIRKAVNFLTPWSKRAPAFAAFSGRLIASVNNDHDFLFILNACKKTEFLC